MRPLELVLVDKSNGNPIGEASVTLRVDDKEQQGTSDSRGIASLNITQKVRLAVLSVRKPGYASQEVRWMFYDLPSHFTMKLERSKAIGGVVRNELGEPVAGAEVSGYYPYLGTALSDSEGRWVMHDAPYTEEPTYLKLTHPDYLGDSTVGPFTAKEDLWNETAVLTLRSGVSCEGTVSDIHGQPIEGVMVYYEEEEGYCMVYPPPCKTNAAGYYRFAVLSLANRPVLCFLKEGYALELVELPLPTVTHWPSAPTIEALKLAVFPRTGSLVQNMVLAPGRSMRLRFLDQEGVPIAGVQMALMKWRGHGPFNFGLTGDFAGLVTWNSAPADLIDFRVHHEFHYLRERRGFSPAPEIQLVTLHRVAFTWGRVIDAHTKEPISPIDVSSARFSSFSEPPKWHLHEPYINGWYMVGTSTPLNEPGIRRIRVEAWGYEPAISRDISDDEEKAECHFELVRTL